MKVPCSTRVGIPWGLAKLLAEAEGHVGQPAVSRAPPCSVGRTSEMLCFQLAPAAVEGAGIWEPAHSCRTAGQPAGHEPKHGFVRSPGASGVRP